MKRALVVGAGFAGATIARTLADTGEWEVLVVDKRDHIGGNAYDYTNEHGIRVHRYGPHLWHTSNDEVQEWASRFTGWVPYQHKVRAQLKGDKTCPLPINPDTIEAVFGDRFDVWCEKNGCIEGDQYDGFWVKEGAHAAFLETLVAHHPEVTNARQHVENSVGKELCDLFFEPYTKKMWGLSLDELPASVAARIPTNVESQSDLYFPKDKHQCLPANGYTAMFKSILSHVNIAVVVGAEYRDKHVFKNGYRLDVGEFDHIFTSAPIDVHHDCVFGELPWRSIRMKVMDIPLPSVLPAAVLNFTHDGPYTRVTEWKKLPNHGHNPDWTTVTFEEPCDYRYNDMERYYPVKTSSKDCPNIALYKRYRELAETKTGVTHIGRCGMYVYQDMHAVISTTLSIVKKFLEKQHAQV